MFTKSLLRSDMSTKIRATTPGCNGHKVRRSRITVSYSPPHVPRVLGAQFESDGSFQLVWVTHEAC